MSNNEIDIHMSDLDEETKRIQQLVDAQTTDDSKKIKKPSDEYVNKKNKSDENTQSDIHEEDDVDDREW